MELINVVHTGKIYEGKENPAPMFEAVALLIKRGTIRPNEIKIDHYGPVYDFLAKEAERCGLNGVLVQHGVVRYEQAIEAQRDARVLWLMKWEEADKGVIPGKFYEYMAARRPIIVTGGYPDTAIDEMLIPKEWFSLGYWCKTPKEIADYMADIIG